MLYIRSRRIIHALHYKLDNDSSIEETAFDCGYPDQPTFSKACKQVLGHSPSSVSKEILSKHLPLTLDNILKGTDQLMHTNTQTFADPEVLDVSDKQLASIFNLFETNELYGFHPHTLVVIHTLSQRYNCASEDVFDLMEDLVYGFGITEPLSTSDISCIEDTAFLHFSHKLDSFDAFKTCVCLHSEGISVLSSFDSFDEDVLRVYLTETARAHNFTWNLCSIFVSLMNHFSIPLDNFKKVFLDCIALFDGDLLMTTACFNEMDTLPEFYEQNGYLPPHIEDAVKGGKLDLPELDIHCQKFREFLKAYEHKEDGSLWG